MRNCYIERRPGFLGIGRKIEKIPSEGNFSVLSNAGDFMGVVFVNPISENTRVASSPDVQLSHRPALRNVGGRKISEANFTMVLEPDGRHLVSAILRPGDEVLLSKGDQTVKVVNK